MRYRASSIQHALGPLALLTALGPLSCDSGTVSTQSCAQGQPCPAGQACSAEGICVPEDDLDGQIVWPDLSLPPDMSCPSGLMCGKPAVCCAQGEECVDQQCLPACQSGVRCLTPKVVCCTAGQVCLSGQCTAPGDPCKDSFDCQNGFFCEPTLGQCLPQPKDTSCQLKPQSVSFTPTVEWRWTGYSKDTAYHNVMISPAVADIDADGTPEVVFIAYNHNDTSRSMLVTLDGASGKEEMVVPYGAYNFGWGTGVAVGNLDGDPQLEIVVIAKGKGVVVFEHGGKEKWAVNSGSLASAADSTVRPQPAIADLDADGTPEVIVGGVALSAAGKVLFDKGMVGQNGGWLASAVADLDEDGKLEVIGGNVVYDHKGTQVWKNANVPDGLVAVADMDLDGWADVITVAGGNLRVLTGTAKSGKPAGGVIFGPVAIPGGGSGGPPTVGDFDGDGHPEISTAGKGKYAVYDLDCKPGAAAKDCASGATNGILWSATTQDISSSVTGSSLFDFEGDGTVEVVYNDECHLYVLDGKTGAQLMKIKNTSRTAMEYPLIADVDGDNNSEFVVPANNDKIDRDGCEKPGTQGITVFGDSADKWVRTRPVWNQHTYHVTNVGPTGAIPAKEERNWDKQGLNNFRQNSQGEGMFNAPDLTVVGLEAYTLSCPPTIELRARVSNIGSLGVRKGIPVSFYQGSPGGSSTLLATVPTTKPLLPGESELLTASFTTPQGNLGPFDFWVAADDDGTGAGTESECKEDNNTTSITDVECQTIN